MTPNHLDPFAPLRISPAGSRFAHARNTAQVKVRANDRELSGSRSSEITEAQSEFIMLTLWCDNLVVVLWTQIHFIPFFMRSARCTNAETQAPCHLFCDKEHWEMRFWVIRGAG